MTAEKKWLKFKKIFLQWRLDFVLLGLIMSLHYTRLQWNDYIGDPDGFYHAKMASLLAHGRLIKSLPEMQYSTLRDHFTDHQLLYHLLQAPLSLINNDPLLGVKISAVVFAVAMVLVFYYLLKKLNIVWPWFFSLLIITLPSLNFRLSLIKITALSLIMVWLITYALFNKKYRLLSILGFIYVWLYGGWPLAIFIFLAFCLIDYIYNFIHNKKLKLFHDKLIIILHNNDKRFDLKRSGIYLGIGLLAGIIINPYFPYNLYYYLQLMNLSVFNFGQNFTVGGEWYGTNISSIINASPHLFITACIIFIILFFNIKKISRLSWFSFLMSFCFLLLTIKSRRYFEYYDPFLLLFVASGTADFIKIIDWQKVNHHWQSLKYYLKTFLVINFLLLGIIIMPKIYQQILENKMPDNLPRLRYQPAAEWLKNNTPQDSIIYHADWDEWPMLFYYNDHNRYLIGLDFTLMYHYDAELQKKYIDISQGKIQQNLAEEIKSNFHTSYIFVEKEGHASFVENLAKSPDISLSYQDQYFNIYKIR